jgi:hypothetical protein
MSDDDNPNQLIQFAVTAAMVARVGCCDHLNVYMKNDV